MHKADFKSFYETHFDRVYKFLYFRLRNTAVAEDLTSEIFISALKHFHTYDPEKSSSAWIMTIARNRLANYFRDLKQNADVDEIGFMLPGEDGRVSVVKKEKADELRLALDQLGPKDRQLVELKYLLGYDYRDMGELLGKTPGALKVETHRAMKKLRKICSTSIDKSAH